MNPLYETLSEMTLGARLLRGFTAANQQFNPKGMLHCVMFNLNAKGMSRLNQLMSTEKLEPTADMFDDEVTIVDLEKDYFTRPKYVEKYQADLNKLISEWMLDRTDDNIYRVTQHIDNNYKNSLDSWRLKAIGATNDLIVLERNDDIDDDGRWRQLAIASENVPLPWISAFLRDVGEDNRISWYGYNSFSSSYGTATIVDSNNLLIQMTAEALLPVLRELAGTRIPQEDDELTPMQLHEMLGSIDELIGTIQKRGYLHKTKPHTNGVDSIIDQIEKIGLTKGVDYLNLMVYLDQILNQLNYTSELSHLNKVRQDLDDRVTKRTREICTRELEAGLNNLRTNDPRFKDFVLQDSERSMFRFYLMYGGDGTNALIRVYDDRQKKFREEELLLATAKQGLTDEKLKAMADEALDRALAPVEPVSKTAKARQLIDQLVDREEADLKKYIDEVEALALTKDVSLDYAGVLLLLEKLFGDAAKEYLNDLTERDKEDDEFKESYLEVASLSLKPTNYHKVSREELGAFYLWLNTTRHELKKG